MSEFGGSIFGGWVNAIFRSEKGAANGVATLDENGLVPEDQIPDISGEVVHNETDGVQGGTTDEYYHLKVSELTLVTSTFPAHIVNVSNPHGVTAEQIGAVSNPLTEDLDFDNFKITDVKSITFKDGQEITWNSEEYTLNIPTGLGPVLQVGQETYLVVKNDTGNQIDNGKAVRVAGVSGGYQKIVLAKADTFEGIGNGILIATMDIPAGEIGIVTRFGKVRDIDTSGYTLGQPLYLSATEAGALTNTSPTFPAYEIFVGGTLVDSETEGVINVNVRRTKEDTFENFWNGVVRENLKFLVTSNGSTITGTLTAGDGADNLTLICKSGFYLLDVSTPPTITITAGTNTTPQKNYIYILCSTKVLTCSISGYPAVEHIKIAIIVVQTASYTQTYGALRNQNINNDLTDEEGHVVHIGSKIRAMPADWISGVAGSLAVSADPSNVYFSNTAGVVMQMHNQTFPAYNMATGKNVFIVNDPTTPYKPVSNLNTITETAEGDSLDGDWFNLVVWGVVNKTGEVSQIMVNLPTKSYGKEKDALKNKDGGDVYTIPSTFKGVGFLIGRYTVEKDGTEWNYDVGTGYLDLRGFVPNTTAGSGAGSSGVTEFTGLDDTPSTYTGLAGYVATVNVGETALEFVVPNTSGNTASRPAAGLYVGKSYFDTTLGFNIWHDGSNWVDSAGTTV